MDDDGAGVGLDEIDREIHVAGTAPGDRIQAHVEHVSPHKQDGRVRAWARLLRVESEGAERAEPLCAAFGRCGGCAVQHVSIEHQLEWKRQRLTQALADAGVPAALVAPCEPSPHTEGYRNQSKLVVGRDSRGKLALGAYAPRSHTVVDVSGCALVEPILESVADTIAAVIADGDVPPHDDDGDSRGLRHVVLRANAQGQVMVTLVTSGQHNAIEPLIDPLVQAHPEIVSIIQNRNEASGDAVLGRQERTLWGADLLPESIAGVSVPLSSRAFFQVNRHVAEALYQAVQERVADFSETTQGIKSVVDVYAGVGTMARLLQPHAERVVAIENNPTVADAYEETAIEFVRADAAKGLAKMDAAEVVVVNPPRAGCARGAVDEIVRIAPSLLIYVSCSPKTLARDVQLLKRAGYTVESVTPYDMMPHTPHIETLLIMTRAQTD